jgi:hypothetical protein
VPIIITGYVPFVVIIIRSFPQSLLINGLYKCNTTGATSAALTAYLSGAPGLTSVFSVVRVALYLLFCVVFCKSLFLVIILPVLQFTASDYSFGVFKVFFN